MTPSSSNNLRGVAIAAAIIAVFLIPVLTGASIPFMDALERKTHDFRFQLRGPIPPSGQVVIVAIDDRSLDAIGRWPWPRFVMGELIHILAAGGPEAIGIDLLFSETEASPELAKVRDLMTAYQGLGLLTGDMRSQAFFEEMVEALETADNDAYLAEALRNAGNGVLAMVFTAGGPPAGTGEPAFMEKGVFAGKGGRKFPPHLPEYDRVLLPIDRLGAAAERLGFVNVFPDPDGAVRRIRTVIPYRETPYASLSAQLARAGPPQKDDPELPAAFHLNYYGPYGAIPTYSIVDVLTGAVPPETFQDKRVLIGGAAVGLGDHYPAPFASYFWGVEIHATAIENLLTGRYLRRPEWLKYGDAAILIILGLVLGLTLPRLPIHCCFPFAACLIFLLLVIGQYLFAVHRLLMLWVYPVSGAGLISIAIFWMRYATEGREKRLLKAAFQQYLSAPVVERVLRHPEQLALGGEKKTLSVLFADIREFTLMAEMMDPEVLVKFMNRYLTAMTDVVLDNGGTLDKYIGDAIMAVFGAPEDQPDHAHRACRASRQMIDILYQERRQWTLEGFPEIRIGVGVNTGTMAVGNMGSDRRFDYTVMGDNVNLGSRLEGLSKIYGVKIVASEFTRAAVADGFAFRELDLVRVKGRENPVRIYELLTSDNATECDFSFVAPFEKGLAAYRNRQWDDAIHHFEAVCRLKPDDTPAVYFIDRCREFKAAAPPAGWDGVSVAMRK